MTACEQYEMLKPYHPVILDAGVQNENGDTGIDVKVGGVSTVLWDDTKNAKFENGWFWTEDEFGWCERICIKHIDEF